MTSKKCRRCGEEKGLTEYYVKPRGKFGREAECKACHRARVAKA